MFDITAENSITNQPAVFFGSVGNKVPKYSLFTLFSVMEQIQKLACQSCTTSKALDFSFQTDVDFTTTKLRKTIYIAAT